MPGGRCPVTLWHTQTCPAGVQLGPNAGPPLEVFSKACYVWLPEHCLTHSHPYSQLLLVHLTVEVNTGLVNPIHLSLDKLMLSRLGVNQPDLLTCLLRNETPLICPAVMCTHRWWASAGYIHLQLDNRLVRTCLAWPFDGRRVHVPGTRVTALQRQAYLTLRAPIQFPFLKGIRCKVPFYGSALLLFYSVWAMASCIYMPQLMFNNVF